MGPESYDEPKVSVINYPVDPVEDRNFHSHESCLEQINHTNNQISPET